MLTDRHGDASQAFIVPVAGAPQVSKPRPKTLLPAFAAATVALEAGAWAAWVFADAGAEVDHWALDAIWDASAGSDPADTRPP